MLPEEPRCAKLIRIHLVHKWVSILTKRRCVNYYFEVLGHRLQKVIYTRTFKHINVTGSTIHFNRDDIIRIFYHIELRMHKCFV